MQDNSTISPASKFYALTGVRWLAASMVFFYHNRKYWRADVPHFVLQFMNEMDIGVAIFFVLSGFLIAYNYGDKPLTNKIDYLKYFITRVARIIPLYWLILTARYIDYGFPSTNVTLLTYSLFHGFSGVHNLDGIGQAWTLTVEMTFYVLAPIIFFIWNKGINKLTIAILCLIFIPFLIGFIWYKINGNPQSFLYPFGFYQGATFFGRIPEFLAGIWLARAIKQNCLPKILSIKHKTSIGFVGLWIGIYLLALCEPDMFSHGADSLLGKVIFYTFIPFFTMLWLAGLITEKSLMQKFFSSKVLVLLGNASFAFYLVHLSYVNIRLRGYILWLDRNFLFLWIISILLYLLFEKPVYLFIRKKLSVWKK